MRNIQEFMYMSTQNGYSLATHLIETESRNTLVNSEKNMVVIASDGPSPHSPSLRPGLTAPSRMRPPVWTGERARLALYSRTDTSGSAM